MRLDKFLKVSRLIKRRTIAKEICDAGKITVNGRTAKASFEVAVGDMLELHFANRTMKVKIAKVSETIKTQEAADMYEVLGEEKVTEDLF